MTAAFWQRHPTLAYLVDLLAYGLVVAVAIATIIHALPLIWS